MQCVSTITNTNNVIADLNRRIQTMKKELIIFTKAYDFMLWLLNHTAKCGFGVIARSPERIRDDEAIRLSRYEAYPKQSLQYNNE